MVYSDGDGSDGGDVFVALAGESVAGGAEPCDGGVGDCVPLRTGVCGSADGMERDCAAAADGDFVPFGRGAGAVGGSGYGGVRQDGDAIGTGGLRGGVGIRDGMVGATAIVFTAAGDGRAGECASDCAGDGTFVGRGGAGPFGVDQITAGKGFGGDGGGSGTYIPLSDCTGCRREPSCNRSDD